MFNANLADERTAADIPFGLTLNNYGTTTVLTEPCY